MIKQDQFATFIAAMEKLPIPKERNITLYQGNGFINVYKIFFDNHYTCWLKELLLFSVEVTPDNASSFAWWYLGVTDTDEKELKFGYCEVHKCNVSTTRWRNYLDSLTINPNYFEGDPIVSYK